MRLCTIFDYKEIVTARKGVNRLHIDPRTEQVGNDQHTRSWRDRSLQANERGSAAVLDEIDRHRFQSVMPRDPFHIGHRQSGHEYFTPRWKPQGTQQQIESAPHRQADHRQAPSPATEPEEPEAGNELEQQNQLELNNRRREA